MKNFQMYYDVIVRSDNKFLTILSLADLNPCNCEDLINWLFSDYEEKGENK